MKDRTRGKSEGSHKREEWRIAQEGGVEDRTRGRSEGSHKREE